MASTLPRLSSPSTDSIISSESGRESETESESESESESQSDAPPLFRQFTSLPPEIRHQVWKSALPSPGINFFNVHCFPNDHPGANRSTSPPWLYLDLRRLSIDHNDRSVFRYDPSAWQARNALRQVCHEARTICAIPPDQLATLTLTRPKRGLFVRVGDTQVWRLTPECPPYSKDEEFAVLTEPLVHRKIQVHIDDALCLSVENCSFNLPHEEIDSADDMAYFGMGWVYDPQLVPPLPPRIPLSRYCLNFARSQADRDLDILSEPLSSILFDGKGGEEEEEQKGSSSQQSLLRGTMLMCDGLSQDPVWQQFKPLPEDWQEMFWDRFGDRYIKILSASGTGSENVPDYELAKLWPESHRVSLMYVQSASLQSPKRPAGMLLEGP
ncbi:hypothetical protein F4778DRAFT_753886 [Xylariomycetidae sp. FL2044]|nr:hypothetical protein F4778DRAFT_753886 [Xylariomycetidae sp. FL2044]